MGSNETELIRESLTVAVAFGCLLLTLDEPAANELNAPKSVLLMLSDVVLEMLVLVDD